MSITVRRIRPDEAAFLRDFRLRALKTDPDAYSSSYAAEVEYSDGDWETRAARSAEGDSDFVALAIRDDRAVGMAGGYQPESAPGTRFLYGMWVAPDIRASGIGHALTVQVLDWARESGAESLRLWVVTTNLPALALYRKAGFIETGTSQPLPSNPSLLEVEMSLALA